MKIIEGGRKSRRAAISHRPSDAEVEFPLSDFLVPARDSQGQSAKLVLHIPRSMARTIHVLIHKRIFPFETPADIGRWCLSKGMKSLEKMAGDREITSLQAMINSWEAISRTIMEHKHYGGALKKLAKNVETLIREGHRVQARKLVERVASQVDLIEEEYWREKFKQELVVKYKDLVKRG